jgi:hypothetical protein
MSAERTRCLAAVATPGARFVVWAERDARSRSEAVSGSHPVPKSADLWRRQVPCGESPVLQVLFRRPRIFLRSSMARFRNSASTGQSLQAS